MKTLILTFAFIGTVALMFLVLTVITVVLFPVTWLELTGEPVWGIFSILFIGIPIAVAVVSEIDEQNRRTQRTF